ncbi:hypothetical protein [Coleofasciculus sp. FACHB-T130]|uniref:hypothetical protein n=1 Tax=Cyanophyceae TaxID=3028117 RepID=UPI00168407EE|nr:hypothetical protein [Coleofasciculus sp. FACHB-T130]MBD1880212.1 hypothetical protein [Coleofasciculus sp. FACHB-T130]
MSSNILQNTDFKLINNNQYLEISLFITNFKNGIWVFGIPSWLFGLTDRTVASFADGYLSVIEVIHLFTASFFFLSWLYLRPDQNLTGDSLGTIQNYQADANPYQDEGYLATVQARMLELQEQHQHMIGQEYILPFPYVCQIYHLLNLKHLESIHNFSLNNLRVINVSHFQPTAIGGMVKFQTVLDSPINPLRIWRQPIVEVDLTLHSPYTVELSIPVYNGKRIVVIFNAIPLSDTEHKFLVDIYSDLEWPRPLLQFILHFASCLTLFEDLPYLQKLAERNIQRLVSLNRVSNHETMWLFQRFVDLYGSSIESSETKAIKAIDASQEATLLS